MPADSGRTQLLHIAAIKRQYLTGKSGLAGSRYNFHFDSEAILIDRARKEASGDAVAAKKDDFSPEFVAYIENEFAPQR